MISNSDFNKISDWIWEVPKSFKEEMKVPVRVYGSDKTFHNIESKSLNQLVNMTFMPGIVKASFGMPDIHLGYGFPIGGVAAMDTDEGMISPEAIGFDENCGMRLLVSQKKADDIKDYLPELGKKLSKEVPSGVGEGRKEKLSRDEMNKVLEEGVQFLVKRNLGYKEDILNCEEKGKMEKADSSVISKKAKERGKDQLGTLGSGNHFLSVQRVAEIYDKEAAESFSLSENQVVVMIHTGSRGFGYQNCKDYLKTAKKAMRKYDIDLPDNHLACMPFGSPEGKRFFKAMSAGANFAWGNRQMISFYVRKVWKKVLEKEKLPLLYDVAHNIAKVENHKVDGKNEELLVHRKGATRAFPPESDQIPESYKKTGQPVIIPGSMGTSSYILKGTKKGAKSFFSTCHGSGRAMSRTGAKKKFSGKKVVKELKKEGVRVECQSKKGVAEEAPGAYKDINDVIEVVSQAGLAEKVARVEPLLVLKGE